MTEYISGKPTRPGQKTLGSGRKPGVPNKNKRVYVIVTNQSIDEVIKQINGRPVFISHQKET